MVETLYYQRLREDSMLDDDWAQRRTSILGIIDVKESAINTSNSTVRDVTADAIPEPRPHE